MMNTNMRKPLPLRGGMVFFLMVLFGMGLAAQEPILISYKRNFVRASLATKAGILRDAATDDRAMDFIGALYDFALVFALENGELLRDDADMLNLVRTAVRGVSSVEYRRSAESLWKVFQTYKDSLSRVEVLDALAKLGKANPRIIENLNQYLADQNSLFRSGMTPDYPTLKAAVRTLSALGDSSSFPVLFSAVTLGYPRDMAGEMMKALESIQGDYKRYYMDIIRKNPLPEKQAAFRIGAYNEKFSEADRGEVAETALEVTLDIAGSPQEGGRDIRDMAAALRYDAVEALTKLEWTRATPLAIKNFYLVQTDYGNGAVSKDRLIQAINCLGAMGNSEASQALTLQLGYYNAQTEKNGAFDADIILALVRALGKTGDRAAVDPLLYISYLSYPESIKAAAKEALNNLKW